MRHLFFFLTIIFSTLFSYHHEIIQEECDLKILTPSLQNREIVKIRLENGLRALIISDPDIDESAAAMSINAGSWNDSEKHPGTAHFTEHMLFQGTKKYPDRNDFFRFINDQGGTLNAYTALDKTVYMFSVHKDSFEDGLKRFSQFFISPLFDPAAISSELFAVDQEHKKNIENDMRRMSQVWKETSNPNHPNHLFATGNSETLSTIPREELLKWHKDFYHSDQMRLVIYTSSPIEEAIKSIVELFEEVPSKKDSKGEEDLSLPELSSDLQRGHITYIKPIKNIQYLTMQWELPNSIISDETKSSDLIANCINSGHKNSLLNILKKENLVEDLGAYISKIGNYSSIFNITLTLTDDGVINRDQVIKKCFQQLENLKQNGIPPYVFHEMNTMNRLSYEYQSRVDAFDFVSNIASGILDEGIETYPKKTLLASNYSPKTVKTILTSLSANACQIYIIADPEKTGVSPNKKEKWVNVEYAVEPIPTDLLNTLSNIKPVSSIKIPPPNPLIPSNLSINTESLDEVTPINIFNNDFGIGYFIPRNFYTPDIHWIFKIKSPSFNDSYRSHVLFDMFSKVINDNLNDTILQANEGGLYPSLDVSKDEIVLEIKGYNNKAPLLLNIILKKMAAPTISRKQFDNHKNSLEKAYSNSKFNLPVNQASDELNHLLHKNLPSTEDKLSILKTVSFEEQQEFIRSIFSKTYIECLFAGNLSIKNCESIWMDIQTTLSNSPYKNNLDNKKILSLAPGPYKIVKNTDVLGSGIILTIEEGPFSFKRLAAQEILSQSIKEPFFSEMRSKQKTAYFARARSLEKQKHLFQLFAVQSASIPPNELLYRFEIFIDDYMQNIDKNIDKDRFNKIKDNLIIQLKTPPKNLNDMVETYSSLAFTYNDFEWNDKKIKALLDIEYGDFINLANEFLSRNNKRRLAILVEGKLDDKNDISYLTIPSEEIVNSFNYTSTPSFEIETELK